MSTCSPVYVPGVSPPEGVDPLPAAVVALSDPEGPPDVGPVLPCGNGLTGLRGAETAAGGGPDVPGDLEASKLSSSTSALTPVRME